MQKIILLINEEGINWVEFINSNRIQNNSSIESLLVDFTKIDYIKTAQLTSLACLVEEYFINGVAIKFIESEIGEAAQYLRDIQFYNYWDRTYDRKSYTNNFNEYCIGLWKINEHQIDSYTNKVKGFAEKHWINDKEFTELHTTLSELFLNICDHSKSEVSGYCITQYHPTHQEVKISVCDFGVGIPNTVNEFLQKHNMSVLPDEEAISKALEERFSAESMPKNRGLGLFYLKNQIDSCNGKMKLFSGKSVLEYDANVKEFKFQNCKLNGTLFDITLDSSNFELKDTEIFDDKLDF